jgi:hypothetical protein
VVAYQFRGGLRTCDGVNVTILTFAAADSDAPQMVLLPQPGTNAARMVIKESVVGITPASRCSRRSVDVWTPSAGWLGTCREGKISHYSLTALHSPPFISLSAGRCGS